MELPATFNCYDDGKITPSRHCIVTITQELHWDSLSDDKRKELTEIIDEYDYKQKQDVILIGYNENNDLCTFLKTKYDTYFSIEFFCGGLLDISDEFTDKLINELNNGIFDYNQTQIESIIHCLKNKIPCYTIEENSSSSIRAILNILK